MSSSDRSPSPEAEANWELPGGVPFWARSGHVQTLLAARSGGGPSLRGVRSDVRSADGALIETWVAPGKAGPGRGALALVVHGLGGSARSKSVRELVSAFGERGFATAALSLRACGESEARGRLLHSGQSEDLAPVVASLVEQGYGPIHLIGFSLGGNLVARWLGELGGSAERLGLGAAAVLSAPQALWITAPAADRALGGLYARHLVGILVQRARRLVEESGAGEVPFTRAELRGVRSFYRFDDLVTARLHGFDGAEHYWREASAAPLLGRVAVPLTLLHALDDPLIPPQAWEVAIAAARSNALVQLRASAGGGHLGWFRKRPGGALAPAWIEPAIEAIEGAL